MPVSQSREVRSRHGQPSGFHGARRQPEALTASGAECPKDFVVHGHHLRSPVNGRACRLGQVHRVTSKRRGYANGLCLSQVSGQLTRNAIRCHDPAPIEVPHDGAAGRLGRRHVREPGGADLGLAAPNKPRPRQEGGWCVEGGVSHHLAAMGAVSSNTEAARSRLVTRPDGTIKATTPGRANRVGGRFASERLAVVSRRQAESCLVSVDGQQRNDRPNAQSAVGGPSASQMFPESGPGLRVGQLTRIPFVRRHPVAKRSGPGRWD